METDKKYLQITKGAPREQRKLFATIKEPYVEEAVLRSEFKRLGYTDEEVEELMESSKIYI